MSSSSVLMFLTYVGLCAVAYALLKLFQWCPPIQVRITPQDIHGIEVPKHSYITMCDCRFIDESDRDDWPVSRHEK